MTKMKIPVSVIIPTYNRISSVTRAIDSVLAQTYTNFEIIVVDDGSTDNTENILNKRYGKRIRILRQSNMGPAAARNAGIAAARYDLLAFLDSDDYWLPGKLEAQIPLMADDGVVLSFTNWWFGKDSSGRDYFSEIGLNFNNEPCIIDSPLKLMARRNGTGVITTVSVCRKNAILKIGGFDEWMRIYEDTRTWLRLSFEGKFAVTPEPLAVWVWDNTNDNSHLTKPNDSLYQRESAKREFEVFMEAYARAGDFPEDVQKTLTARITDCLAEQTKNYALDKNYRMSRRRAIECLIFLPGGRNLIMVILGLLFPRLLRYLLKSRGNNR